MRFPRLVVMRSRKMRKGGPSLPSLTWHASGYDCELRKEGGLHVLTMRGPGLVMPYHLVCRDPIDARDKVRDVINTLREGNTPALGVYRSANLPATRRAASYGGRTVWP